MKEHLPTNIGISYTPGQHATFIARGIKAGALVRLQRRDSNGSWLSVGDSAGVLLFDNSNPNVQKVKAVPLGSIVLLLQDITTSYVTILYQEHIYEVWAGNLGSLYDTST
ncbi:MAG: hypothetical protein WC761_00125 [Candidatus Paceibacterota bacterium]|jgi:hypothetical protein